MFPRVVGGSDTDSDSSSDSDDREEQKSGTDGPSEKQSGSKSVRDPAGDDEDVSDPGGGGGGSGPSSSQYADLVDDQKDNQSASGRSKNIDTTDTTNQKFDDSQVQKAANDLQKQVLSAPQNQLLSPEDVKVTREGDKLKAELTKEGRETKVANLNTGVSEDELQVAPDTTGLGVEFTGRNQRDSKPSAGASISGRTTPFNNRVKAAGRTGAEFAGVERKLEKKTPAELDVSSRGGELQVREQDRYDLDWSFGLGGEGDETEQALESFGKKGSAALSGALSPLLSATERARESNQIDPAGGPFHTTPVSSSGIAPEISGFLQDVPQLANAPSNALETVEGVNAFVDEGFEEGAVFRAEERQDERTPNDIAQVGQQYGEAAVEEAKQHPQETAGSLLFGTALGSAAETAFVRGVSAADVDTPDIDTEDLTGKITQAKNDVRREIHRRRNPRPEQQQSIEFTQEEIQELGLIEVRDFGASKGDGTDSSTDSEGDAEGGAAAGGDSTLSVGGGSQKFLLKTRQGDKTGTGTEFDLEENQRLDVESVDDLSRDAGNRGVFGEAVGFAAGVDAGERSVTAEESVFGEVQEFTADEEELLGQPVDLDQQTNLEPGVETRTDVGTETETDQSLRFGLEEVSQTRQELRTDLDLNRPRRSRPSFDSEGFRRRRDFDFGEDVWYHGTGIASASDLLGSERTSRAGRGRGIFGEESPKEDRLDRTPRTRGSQKSKPRNREGGLFDEEERNGGLFGGASRDVFGSSDGRLDESRQRSRDGSREKSSEGGVFGGDSQDVFGGGDSGLFGDDEGVF